VKAWIRAKFVDQVLRTPHRKLAEHQEMRAQLLATAAIAAAILKARETTARKTS
jgi:hypothetical protein